LILTYLLTERKIMNQSRRNFVKSVAAVTAAGTAIDSQGATVKASRKLSSASAMAIAADGKLIVADWRAGALVAISLPVLPAVKERSFNVLNVADRLADAYKLDAAKIRITASAFHAESQTAILAVSLGKRVDSPVAIALMDANGKVKNISIDAAVAATQPLLQPPSDASLWGKQSTRTLLVTDMKFYGNELIVAGLTNATLRRVPYPFSGGSTATNIEMYHAVHNQIETRAPVRAFNIIDVDGAPTLLAAYTCTPLVTAPLSELKDGGKVRGKTIAELGFGNTPLDVIPFAIEYQGKKSEWVMVANSAKAADLISLPDIVSAAKGEGLSTPVKAPFAQHAGVRAIQLPMTNLQKILDQGPQFLLALRRDAASGDLQLVSIRKGAFFRLSDHVNEYDFASYAYPESDKFQQEYIRPFHKMMKADEGHAALIK
jgi:hypothetical protein